MRKLPLLPLLFVLSAFLISGCIGAGQGQQGQNQTQQNASLAAQYGDTVTVDYTLTVDGKVLDTSQIDVAKQAGVFNPAMSYQPLTFRMLLGGSMINGFVNGMLGMRAGEAKNFTVAPADGYGLSDPQKIYNMTRYYNMSVFEDVPMDYFTAQNITIAPKKVIASKVGYVGVYNYTNDTVTIMYLLAEGNQFAVDGIPETVVSVGNESMVIRVDLEENKTYTISDPATGDQRPTRVTHADNETLVMDENSPLAGKELQFEVIMRSITRQ